jgi:hypothetical protein
MVLLRLQGVLTGAEEKLARDSEGHCLIKGVRKQLIEGSRDMLDEMIQAATGVQVPSLHRDISIKRGEREMSLPWPETWRSGSDDTGREATIPFHLSVVLDKCRLSC